MFIEPLLIIPSNPFIANWQHPQITKYTQNLEKYVDNTNNEELLYFKGGILGLTVYFQDNMFCSIVVMTDEEGMRSIITEEDVTHYIRHLSLKFSSSNWQPDNDTKFHNTDFGKVFNKVYPMSNTCFDLRINDKIVLVSDHKVWWYI